MTKPREVNANLYNDYIGTYSYCGTVYNTPRNERRRLIANLDKWGYTCKLQKISHNSEHYTFHYVVNKKPKQRRAKRG